jgi:hypothetical protein
MNLPTIINLPRCGGKTTALVYASAIDKVPILCLNKQNKKYIEDLAKKLGLSIPEPLTCNTEDLIKLGRFDFEEILIDNSEFVIPVLIEELAGAKIKGMTMSVPMVHPEQKTFSENQIDELVETIKSRSFKETAYEAAQRLQKTWKDFGFSIN